jgi:mono/diheme cytochrome c family protein
VRLPRKLLALALVVLVLAIGAVGWLGLRPHGPTDFAGGARVELADYRGGDPTGAPPSIAGTDMVARGEYLTRAADCVACHTAPGGKPFAGGMAFPLPFGSLYSTNITPDKDTGIGAWSDEDFVKALHEGVGRDGKHLYPAFPYTSYTLMTRSDVLAVKAYLFSLKPVRNRPPASDISFPFNQRYLIWFWNGLFSPGQRFQPNTGQTPEWNRGAYLVEALGHCGECHTPRNLLYGLSSGRKFAGAMVNGWKAYNITSDPAWGIGAWSDAQLADYLSSGHGEGRSSAAGPMGEAVENSLRFLGEADIRAMAAYLKSVPALHDSAGVAAVQTPSAQIQGPKAGGSADSDQGLGLRVFEGACASCHSFDGSGAVSVYASLAGNRTVNDAAAVNATQVILQGARLRTAHGEVFMSAFGTAYSDAEIAAVLNYVTGRFGTNSSAIKPDDVAKRRTLSPSLTATMR